MWSGFFLGCPESPPDDVVICNVSIPCRDPQHGSLPSDPPLELKSLIGLLPAEKARGFLLLRVVGYVAGTRRVCTTAFESLNIQTVISSASPEV